MSPGNAACLHRWLQEFAEYSSFEITLGDKTVTIHHSQFAQYPLERAVRTVYDSIEFDPGAYDDYDAFRDAFFDQFHDQIETAIAETNGVTVDSHDEMHFDRGAYVKPLELADAGTRLIDLYDGFEPDDPDIDPYERYGERRDWPTTTAQLIADLFTLYHVRLAEDHLTPLRMSPSDREWTEREANIALYAMRDLIEKNHGWSVFAAPDPARDTIDELWTMQEEIGFPKKLRWVYALFIVPYGAKFYEPKDTLDTSLRALAGASIREELSGTPTGYRYTAEETSLDEFEAYRDQSFDETLSSTD